MENQFLVKDMLSLGFLHRADVYGSIFNVSLFDNEISHKMALKIQHFGLKSCFNIKKLFWGWLKRSMNEVELMKHLGEIDSPRIKVFLVLNCFLTG